PQARQGKTSPYPLLMQMCREKHKQKILDIPVNCAAFSKKCSERQKTMSGKENSKFDEMAMIEK
ncbi:High mobility group protein B3, partial [Heterocephalus glaber]